MKKFATLALIALVLFVAGTLIPEGSVGQGEPIQFVTAPAAPSYWFQFNAHRLDIRNEWVPQPNDSSWVAQAYKAYSPLDTISVTGASVVIVDGKVVWSAAKK